jgi:hypothetical protein
MPLYPSSLLFPGPDVFPGVALEDDEVTGYLFRTPVLDVAYRIEGSLHGVMPYGVSVWQTDGVWEQGIMPPADTVAAADRFYGGGRDHPITSAERADLVAAGYGDYITEEE